jgi:putative FmdB family regulatory protein
VRHVERALSRAIISRGGRQALEIAMPTDQYRCDECGEEFEPLETISEHETSKAKCPKCESKNVSQIPGKVFVVTSKKS